ncbi:MAG TPA: FHA domain-containing protein, partial [Dehalococcoidia bacterium]
MIAPGPPGFALYGVNAHGEALEQPLSPGQTVAGRAPDCDLVLPGGAVSCRHARFVVGDGGAAIEDLDSRSGVYVNDERVRCADLCPGDRIRIGDWLFELRTAGGEPPPAALAVSDAEVVTVARPHPHVAAAGMDGVLPDWLLRQPVLDEHQIAQAGVELRTAQYAALGGGLGSFAWVSLLRNSGVPAHEIAVAGSEARPGDRFEWLCQNSQIPPQERLRSNSDARPDNLWGFPGYATSELARDVAHLRLGSALRILWQIAAEPALAETYTPRRGDIFAGVNREADRIGWQGMLLRGRLCAIRKSSAGRLLAVVSQSDRRRHL